MYETVAFDGRIIMLGYGSVGQCVLPALPRHFQMPSSRITVIEDADHSKTVQPFLEAGVRYERIRLTPANLEQVLADHAGPGDLVLNLTAGVDAISIMDWCQRHGALYVDTSLEPWAEKYEDMDLPPWARTHYESHEQIREFARSRWQAKGPTCVVTHGANPGIVNHFVKRALINIAGEMGLGTDVPQDRAGWAALAQATATKVIHIAERDTQRSSTPKNPNEFVNT